MGNICLEDLVGELAVDEPVKGLDNLALLVDGLVVQGGALAGREDDFGYLLVEDGNDVVVGGGYHQLGEFEDVEDGKFGSSLEV